MVTDDSVIGVLIAHLNALCCALSINGTILKYLTKF